MSDDASSRLLDRVFQDGFDESEISTAFERLPKDSSRVFLREVLGALRGKMTILNLASFLAPKLELASFIQDVIFKVSEILDAERSSLFVVDKHRSELFSKVAQNLEIQEIRVPFATGVAGRVATTRETIVIDDAYQSDLFNPEVDKRTGFRTRTILCMPILSINRELIGVVQAINKRTGKFEDKDVQMLSGITQILALMLENSLLYEKVIQGQRQVSSLLKVANSLTAQLDLTSLIQTIMTKASEIMNADRASLFLIDKETGELYSRMAQGLDIAEIRIPRNRGIAGHVANSGETLNIPDAYANPLFNRETDIRTGYKTRNMLCIPIKDRDGQVAGVTQVINKKTGHFDTSDEELLGAFSAQASIAIENAQLYERTMNLKNFFESILNSLSNAVLALDASGAVSMANPAASKLLEMSAANLIGQKIDALFAQCPAVLERMQRTHTADGSETDYDQEVVTPSGKKLVCNLTSLPLQDIKGKRIGAVLIMEDITKEKRWKSNLTRYMSRDLVDKVLSDSGHIGLGGVRQEVTILFSDIRSFTSLTESVGATDIVAMLNEYFSKMVDAVFKYQGVLDKFIGDAIMALFGAPLPRPDHALSACQSALEMRRQLAILNESRRERGFPPISIGIGISTGDVLCGNIGSEKRMEYTAIGDGVNLASRLEGANKLYGTDIMISEYTYERVRDHVVVRELDHIRVKGKEEAVRVFELVSLADDPLTDARQALLESYRAGIEHYRERRFTDAVRSFEHALSIESNDLPSRTYVERCNYFSVSPPPADWDGIWALKDK